MVFKSKTKGKNFERDTAKFLSNLYNLSFVVVPYSGAFVGGKNIDRKKYLDESQIRSFKSDIIPPENWNKLNIECKNYADFPFHKLFRSNKIVILDKWIEQVYAASDIGDINLIILKFNNKGKFVMFEKKINLISNEKSVLYDDWFFMDFDLFWGLNKDKLKILCE